MVGSCIAARGRAIDARDAESYLHQQSSLPRPHTHRITMTKRRCNASTSSSSPSPASYCRQRCSLRVPLYSLLLVEDSQLITSTQRTAPTAEIADSETFSLHKGRDISASHLACSSGIKRQLSPEALSRVGDVPIQSKSAGVDPSPTRDYVCGSLHQQDRDIRNFVIFSRPECLQAELPARIFCSN